MLRVILAAGAMSGSQAGAQAITLRAALAPGQEHAYRLVRTLDVNEPGGDGTVTPLHASVDVSFKLAVLSVRADGSSELRMSVEALSVHSSSSDGAGVDLAWSAEDADAPAIGKPNERPPSGAKPDFQALARSFATMHPRLEVNSDGELTAVEGLDEWVRAGSKGRVPDVLDPGLRMLDPRVLVHALAPIVLAGGAAAEGRTFKAGDQWGQALRLSLGATGTLTVTDAWTLGGVTQEKATAHAGVTVTLEPSSLTGQVAPKVTVQESSGDADLTWDVAGHRLLELKRSLQVRSIWALGDLSVPSKIEWSERLSALD